MDIRRSSCVAVLALLPAAARADRHRPDEAVTVGPSFGSTLASVHVSGSYPLFYDQHHMAEVSVIGISGWYHGTEKGTKTTMNPLLLGLRTSFPGGIWMGKTKFAVFLQGAATGLRRTERGVFGAQYPFAAAGSAGAEWPACEQTRLRLQADTLLHRSHGQWNRLFSISLGVSTGEKLGDHQYADCIARYKNVAPLPSP